MLLVVLMDLFGNLQAEYLQLVAPLFLLPVAVVLCTTENRYLRRVLVGALLIAAAVGWTGAYTRRYYATARFVEPWAGLAAETAGAVQQGAGLVSNSPSLFLYLTYDAVKTGSPPVLGFPGFLPNTVRNPRIWNADEWKAAGRPAQPYMIWIDAAASPTDPQPMADAADSLAKQCGGRVARFLVRDPAYDWKKRLFPQLNAAPWRIEIRQYLCNEKPQPAAAPPTPNPAR